MKQRVHPQTFIVNQSMIIIFEHRALFMWNQYRQNIVGNWAESTEKESEILRIGERGRECKWRERERRGF